MTEAPSIHIDEGLLDDFVAESLDALAAIDGLLVRFEHEPNNLTIVNDIFRPVHSIKGNAPFFGLNAIRVLAHDLESLLAMVRDGKKHVTSGTVDVLLRGIDLLRTTFTELATTRKESIDSTILAALNADLERERKNAGPISSGSVSPRLRDAIEGLQKHLSTASPELQHDLQVLFELVKADSAPGEKERPAPAATPPAQTTPQPSASSSERPSAEHHKTMRVSEEHIDTFLSYVGELFLFGETLSYLVRRLSVNGGSHSDLSFEFTRQVEIFKVLTRNLQRSLMSIRKVSVKSLLGKIPRTVRDIASRSGKSIAIDIIGDDLEMDKSLLELIDAPLTHMVRNAADHGIERPEQRALSNKPAEGKISISLSEGEKFFTLKIQDDGGGLNYDALTKKARTLGIIGENATLSDERIVDLIFLPGVSTAKEVTDISGRGVGMEVVKRAIEDSGGKISVMSAAGKGTIFTVDLAKSVTTNIAEGVIFRVKSQYFIVPAERVIEVFSCSHESELCSLGDAQFVKRRNAMIPLVAVGEHLGTADSASSEIAQQAITVRSRNGQVGLLVNEVIGMQQVVLKELGSICGSEKVFEGAALIGDGQIALLMNVDHFCTRAGLTEERKESRATEVVEEQAEEKKAMLVITAGGGQLAVNLEEISRLERADASQIEYSMGAPVIKYNDLIMPLAYLSRPEDLDTQVPLNIVIIEDQQRLTGIVVDKIVDIVSDSLHLNVIGSGGRGYIGTTTLNGRMTDVLSLRRFADEIFSQCDHQMGVRLT